MYRKTTLPNGLRVITSSMPHTGSVAISVFVGIGSRYESDREAGISHFIEHLCFKGTPRRPTSREITTEIEGVGGIINAATDKELTVYWCKVAKQHYPMALDVLCDILLNSRFDPTEIEREREVIIDEINMTKDMPAQQVSILIDEIIWPGHPMGRDIAGSKESMTGIDRDLIVDFQRNKYSPENTVVSIAGNIKHADAVAAVRDFLGNWQNQGSYPSFESWAERPSQRIIIESRETEQAHLCLALPGLSLLHPARFSIDILNVILGEGMSSRLFTEIRDRLGLAYSIYSYTDHYLDTGSIGVYAGVAPKNLAITIEAILAQLAQLKVSVPEGELAKAKEQVKGRLLLRMEDTRHVAGWGGGQEVLTGRILENDEVSSIIDDITVGDLKQVAEELFSGDRLHLAVVGPVDNAVQLENLLKL